MVEAKDFVAEIGIKTSIISDYIQIKGGNLLGYQTKVLQVA